VCPIESGRINASKRFPIDPGRVCHHLPYALIIHQLKVLVSLPSLVNVNPVPSCAVIETFPIVPPVVALA